MSRMSKTERENEREKEKEGGREGIGNTALQRGI